MLDVNHFRNFLLLNKYGIESADSEKMAVEGLIYKNCNVKYKRTYAPSLWQNQTEYQGGHS